MFGERALLNNAPRAANVTATTKLAVFILNRRQFDRILGQLDKVLEHQYQTDPRKIIADFYNDGDGRGPLGALLQKSLKPETRNGKSTWFVVYRPTSRDAISKMLNGGGVGKGLNVKGKSAKQGVLSGFVPFCQVSDNKHKPMVEQSPRDARTKVYYKSKASREEARQKLENIGNTMDLKTRLTIENLNDYAPLAYGFDVPEAVIREAYIMRPDLSPVFGWETGRRSEPFSMDMNLHSTRGDTGKEPEVVLWQWDDMDVMNPRGLLIAYAEQYVKPVVSDFDTFTVASQGMSYDVMSQEYTKLMAWSLDKTETVLRSPDHQAWTSRWIDILRIENENGFHPKAPYPYGFGDKTSIELITGVVQATATCGAVRHGPECFNFHFPQELDDEFLVVWKEFKDKPWQYFGEEGLRTFLLERIKDGYAFPINPVWAVRDKGWYAVLEALRSSPEGKKVLPFWYPEFSKVNDKIDLLHKEFPACFVQEAAEEKRETKKQASTRSSEPIEDSPETGNTNVSPKGNNAYPAARATNPSKWLPSCFRAKGD